MDSDLSDTNVPGKAHHGNSLVLVLNCGSSSIKFAILDPRDEKTLLNGLAQCVATPNASIEWKYSQKKHVRDIKNFDYHQTVDEIIKIINEIGGIVECLIGVGHRVVHGGEHFTKSVVIDDKVLDEIKACVPLAPLHNPAHIIGIEAVQKVLPDIPQVAVFDTAFHQTMPAHAYVYAIPYSLYKESSIRRYGFHGTSHLYVTHTAAKILGKQLTDSAFVSAHLGNGCSVASVLNGKSVDTSMGITPLEGLVMGTRSGDVDPSLHALLGEMLGYSVKRVTDMLNKESGLLGISGKYSDMRNLSDAAEKGDDRAILAIEVFCYRLAKYIMSMVTSLSRLDALIFTGGIGENAVNIREKVLSWLQVLQFNVDCEKNKVHGKNSNGVITIDGSPIAIVIPTNEELVIAQDTMGLVAGGM